MTEDLKMACIIAVGFISFMIVIMIGIEKENELKTKVMIECLEKQHTPAECSSMVR